MQATRFLLGSPNTTPLTPAAFTSSSSSLEPRTFVRPNAIRTSIIRASSADQPNLNKFSSRITGPHSQGGSQAILYGVGLSDRDMDKPQVGISSIWYEGNTCNMHLMKLAEAVKEGVEEAGMVGMRFNTIGVSDAISMGTGGIRYSLQSRDLIADRTIIAMGRLNRPSIMIYGGTMRPGHFGEKSLDIVSAFQAQGEFVSNSITIDERNDVVRSSCPGAGACGGMYTANTMASAIEAMGMSLPYSSSTPAEDPLKLVEGHLAGKHLLELLKMDLKPRDILTRQSLRNAMVIVMALGGLTNSVLHLIAIARSVGLDLTLDDFQKVSDEVPFLANIKPNGKYAMSDVHKNGGTPAIMRYLLEMGYLDGDCLTVTGKTLAENAKSFPSLADGQQLIWPVDNPIKKTGHIQTLYGNVAPGGSVAKIKGQEGLYFSGPALVFEGEEAMLAAISENPDNFKGRVVVLRGEGPKGGPGMPEMLRPTSAVMRAGLGKEVALLTDGRFSGGSHGFVVGHICPEAQLEERKKKWSAPAYKASRGTMYKYIKNVKSASYGCVTDE
uniref:dihydroxy-acid dehydratase n=1 Tax=Kalanchoe fedtschenkoi TaxID=63787 RepID=A0A7N0ZY79_KALFE